jgi:acetyl esterase/lipase
MKESVFQHPVTDGDVQIAASIRETIGPGKVSIGPDTRAIFDEIMEHTPIAEGVTFVEETVGDVPGWWAFPPETRDATQVILYLHGGAFLAGSAKAYRGLAGQIAVRANAPTFIADYRLAPENPYPAAIDDAFAAFTWLAEKGYSKIALAGDSAGGGLVFALASKVGSKAVGVLGLSPWTDLALESPSMVDRADADPYLTKKNLSDAANSYLGSIDPKAPLASPLYGEFAGSPPVLIHVGEDEILLDDSRRIHEKITAAGGKSELHVWECMPHVFPSNVGTFAASSEALEIIGSFLREVLAS